MNVVAELKKVLITDEDLASFLPNYPKLNRLPRKLRKTITSANYSRYAKNIERITGNAITQMKSSDFGVRGFTLYKSVIDAAKLPLLIPEEFNTREYVAAWMAYCMYRGKHTALHVVFELVPADMQMVCQYLSARTESDKHKRLFDWISYLSAHAISGADLQVEVPDRIPSPDTTPEQEDQVAALHVKHSSGDVKPPESEDLGTPLIELFLSRWNTAESGTMIEADVKPNDDVEHFLKEFTQITGETAVAKGDKVRCFKV